MAYRSSGTRARTRRTVILEDSEDSDGPSSGPKTRTGRGRRGGRRGRGRRGGRRGRGGAKRHSGRGGSTGESSSPGIAGGGSAAGSNQGRTKQKADQVARGEQISISSDSADDVSPEDAQRCIKRRRQGELQQEVTSKLLERVDDYVEKELGVANVIKKLSSLARVIGSPDDEEKLKEKVSSYVSQYIRALMTYRVEHADPYGDGVDETSVTPMINMPKGNRKEPLPGKILFDSVSSCGLPAKFPEGLRARAKATKNDILMCFNCFSMHRKSQNYFPFLLPNKDLERLPGFASPEKRRADSWKPPEVGNFTFLWNALRPDIDRYKLDLAQFQGLWIDRFPGNMSFLVVSKFWQDYATLSLSRNIEKSVDRGLHELYWLRKEGGPESWLKAKKTQYAELDDFSLIILVAHDAGRSLYAQQKGRFRLMRDDICAFAIYGDEEGSKYESRALGYVWQIENIRGEKTWTVWVPGRWLLRNEKLSVQAVPLFQGISEVRRAKACGLLGSLHHSLGVTIFSPKYAPEIRYQGHRHLLDDHPAQILYKHYKPILNDSQFQVLDKIMMALSKDQEDGGNSVIAVQGPPGTGKSRVIVCAVALLLAKMETEAHEGKRILVCAPSNAAVDVLARRLNEGIDMAVTDKDPPYRIKVQKKTPSMIRIGPGCKDKRLSRIKIKGEVARRLDSKGIFDGERRSRAEAQVEKEILQEKDIWCSTLMNIMNEKYMDKEIQRDLLAVIVDEAAQAVEIDCLMPLLTFRQNKPPLYILVGDTKQLPPFQDLPEGRKITDQSLLGRILGYMQHTSNNCVRLNTQYRMHHAIARFPAGIFYKGYLENAPRIYNGQIFERPYHFDAKGRFGPVTFIDTKNIARNVEYYAPGDSACNHCEAEVVKGLVTALVRLHDSSVKDGVVLLSPYSKQLALLSDMCKEVPEMSQVAVTTSTVDSMQGDEAGVIIMSTVRSNWKKELGFLTDYRRVNVGMTRARYSLIVVGNSETLESDERSKDTSNVQYAGVWKRFISYCRNDRDIYTHYICPEGRSIAIEAAIRELFPEFLASRGSIWRIPRFELPKDQS